MNYEKEKKEIEQKFNQVKAQLEQSNQQSRQFAEELQRLQGEHRMIVKLEQEDKKEEKK